MSMAIQFSDLGQLRSFLEWFARSSRSRSWQDDDRLHIRITTSTVPGPDGPVQKRSYQPLLWFDELDTHDQEQINRQLMLMPVPAEHRYEHLPAEVTAAGSKWIALEMWQFLEKMEIVRSGKVTSTGHADCLIAIYGDPEEPVPEEQVPGAPVPTRLSVVFNSLAKNPDHPSQVTFLERGLDATAPDDRPCVLISLPRSTRQPHWGTWLARQNRRVAEDAPPVVRVFRRLPGGEQSEYFLEHGWLHPLPELVDLDNHPTPAHQVLITAEKSGATRSRTCWTRILLGPDSRQLEQSTRSTEPFRIELQDDIVEQVIATEFGTRQHTMVPVVQPYSAEGRARLESLDRRIQASKSTLFDLERRRKVLMEQQRDRFDLVMRFPQPPATAGALPRVASRFQQFLLATRQELDRFSYLYQEDGNGGGWHVVMTQEPRLYQDVQYGLADEVYYRPACLRDWDVGIFVRHHHQLLPRLDDQQLAESFRDVVDRVLARNPERTDAGTIVLLNPAAEDHGPPILMPVPLHGIEEATTWMTFLNQEFPLVEHQTRIHARANLLHVLQQLQVDTEEEVTRLEEEFKQQATQRLQRAQDLWNATSTRIEQAADFLEFCQARFELFEEVVGEFALSWRRFVDSVLHQNKLLIEDKLKVLEKLDRAEAEWPERLVEVDRGNEDVLSRLPLLSEQMDELLEESGKRHEVARRKHAEVLSEAEQAEVELEGARRDVERQQEEAETAHERATAIEVDLQQRQQALDAVLERLRASHQRVERFVEQFAETHETAQRETEAVGRWQQKLIDARNSIDQTRENWQQAHEVAQQKATEVRTEHAAADAEIAELEVEIAALNQRTDQTTAQINDRLQEISRQKGLIRQMQQEQQQMLQLLLQEKDTQRQLHTVLNETQGRLLQQVQDNHSDAQVIQAVATEIERVLENLRVTSRARFENIVQDLKETAGELDRLAEFETSSAKFRKRFRKAIHLRHDALAGLQQVSRHENLLRSIWREDQDAATPQFPEPN